MSLTPLHPRPIPPGRHRASPSITKPPTPQTISTPSRISQSTSGSISTHPQGYPKESESHLNPAVNEFTEYTSSSRDLSIGRSFEGSEIHELRFDTHSSEGDRTAQNGQRGLSDITNSLNGVRRGKSGINDLQSFNEISRKGDEELGDGHLEGRRKSLAVGVMGGLRERSDDEINRAGKDEVVMALKEEWSNGEKLMERIEEMEMIHASLESDKKNLARNIQVLQERQEESLAEQSRLETDLEERNDILDRIRSRLSEAERNAREAQRRYAEQLTALRLVSSKTHVGAMILGCLPNKQEKSFDAERQAFLAQEQHLQTRLIALKSSTVPVKKKETNEQAQEELASLHVAHSAILAQLHTLSAEVHELRGENVKLKEENEGWEFLVRDRTFNENLRGGFIAPPVIRTEDHDDLAEFVEAHENDDDEDGFGNEDGRKGRLGTLGTLDEEIDEEIDEEMEELHSDLEAQSPIFEDENVFAKDLDSVPVSTKGRRKGHKGDLLAPPPRRKSKGENLGDLPVTGSGLDLAAELGRAEAAQGGEMRVLGKGDEGEDLDGCVGRADLATLRAEVKQLREANKALTLYCSKIIDRIIAQEGFEQILSVDYKTRRMGRSASGMSRKPTAQEMFALTPSISDSKLTGAGEAKSRPMSVIPTKISAPVLIEEKEREETKAEKRSLGNATDCCQTRRGFSLDLRSFGFGSSSEKEKEKEKSALKPLALVGRTAPLTQSSQPPQLVQITQPTQSSQSLPSGQPSQRKLDPEAEDENDRKERHLLEATLKLMGIDKPSTSSSTPQPIIFPSPSEDPQVSWLGKLVRSRPSSIISPFEQKQNPFISPNPSSISSQTPQTERNNPINTNTSPPSSQNKEGPLSRLSSILGSYEPLSPTSTEKDPTKISPEKAAEALRLFDEREKRRAKDISDGKGDKTYTSPGPKNLRRSMSSRSGEGDGSPKRVGKNESISTLWSMGSRPSSEELEGRR
ncbi:hypothetical protein TREMEDRAFT_60894 [Tremella mesenterica DSM 1558]|uniref:uncharacterized protein n=1 Tax=Tremella mesenterica (strain ATCC 24925 / CBS 8224 / DSM 1558 / NBRC 9311 / NRRL Y-6157 / RJB 2259-6 / UBC 559-6) TaxID=578456 RepID=UPI0003F4A468|nr:uncharacterized protein TREMEDRAFT_60894 [Tremella mesenterica DSM 1558]EIW70397.1 hypothetical protein TREMEDRAFT_60894 [Tremella mesenterica DSM 1558]